MKILIALPRFPFPLEKGDKLRAYNQIKELSKRNEIYLFCVSHSRVQPEHVEVMRPFCKGMRVVQSPLLTNYKNVVRNYFSTKSLQIGYWDSRRARKAFKAFEAEVCPDVIYSQMVRTMPLVSRSPRPKVMDFQDALSMNTERRMEHSRGLWHYILHYEFKMLRSTEYNAFKIFDALTIISQPDSEAIPRKLGSDIAIIPNGVDFDFFAPLRREKTHDIVFCGNMAYNPNVRTATFLARMVMPIVWETHPEARLLLAGATPKAEVRCLASDRVTVRGNVDDIRECYASAQIFAAPMQTGSGLQNKLLEAMAMGLPCVTTSMANASLAAEPGSEVLVSDDAEGCAAHICRLLDDDGFRSQLAAAGNAFVHSRYGWEEPCRRLEAVLQSVCGKETLVMKEVATSKKD